MLIYANQAMTSHQYNIWTKDIVWKQLYGLLCEFCEHFSLKAQVSYCCPRLLFRGRGFKDVQMAHITPMRPMGTVLRAITFFLNKIFYSTSRSTSADKSYCV